MIKGGHTVEVYRHSARDRYGDRLDSELVGTIPNCVVQWGVSTNRGVGLSQVEDFPGEHAGVTAILYAPRNATVRIRARDRLKFLGKTWQVVGDPVWDENHPVSGYNFGYYLVQIEAMV